MIPANVSKGRVLLYLVSVTVIFWLLRMDKAVIERITTTGVLTKTGYGPID